MKHPLRNVAIPLSRGGGILEKSGLTLVEVMVAMVIVATVTLGTLSVLLSTRQMTDFARKQMLVDTAMQGLAEQLRNRTAIELLPTPIPGTPPCLSSMSAMKTYLASGGTALSVNVELDNDPTNPLNKLIISPDPYLDPSQITPGAVPIDSDGDGFGDINNDGADDVGVNVLTLDVRGTNGLNGSPSSTADDIKIYVMVWIQDYTTSAPPLTVPSRAILINYTWTYQEGKIQRKMVDSVRVVRTLL